MDPGVRQAQDGRRELKRALTFTVIALLAPAKQHPRPPWPAWWYAAAMCVHRHEGAMDSATGNGYEGGWQFLPSTYASVGGRVVDANGRRLVYRKGRFNGTPWHWASLDSPLEQLRRVRLVYLRDGNSFREWGTARLCNLR